MYTFKCNGIVAEFSSKDKMLAAAVRHRARDGGLDCQDDHILAHNDSCLVAVEELTFLGLGFKTQFIDGLTKPDRPGAEIVPGEFFAVNKKYLNDKRLITR